METYKFRGKHGNDWVYGSLISGKYPVIVNSDSGEETRYSVEPKSVSLFIGLHDRNGIEIFSDDILKSFNAEDNDFFLYGDMSTIIYDDAAYCVVLIYDMTSMQLCCYDMIYNPTTDYPEKTYLSTWLKDFEVVGNYFENKDILTRI